MPYLSKKLRFGQGAVDLGQAPVLVPTGLPSEQMTSLVAELFREPLLSRVGVGIDKPTEYSCSHAPAKIPTRHACNCDNLPAACVLLQAPSLP